MRALLAVLFSTFVMLAGAAHADVKIGDKPDFSGKDALSGKEFHLKDQAGKIVVLEWTNPECPFVKKHYGSDNMQALQKELTGKGVVWVSINSSAKGKEGYETDAEAKKSVEAAKASPSFKLLDPSGAIGKQFGAKTTPHMFVIGKDGSVAYMGAIDDDSSANPANVAKAKNYVRTAVNELLEGKPVSETTTQSYGCSVKY
ncbi:redoxin domain-containing protein [bacterium]|nr:redoxin domain-containing protein [bacterium]